MTHRFPLKEIARQSGLSTATVDRAINNRAHVSPQTKARVAAAISELEGQEGQLSARGRRLFFDFVIEAPSRFSREVQHAAEQVLPRIANAVCRPRFLAQEIMDEDDVVSALSRIAKRGSHGVCIKARDLPKIRAAVDQLIASGIPVVTLVTDLTTTKRIAYVGLDNQSAGRTAAYLIAKSIGEGAGTVLTSKSNSLFLGEEEREVAFKVTLSRLCPKLCIVDANGGSGVHFETARIIQSVVEGLDKVRAVYSMGGGNKTILEVLKQNALRPDIFVAHDLDNDNRTLIEQGNLSFVLHHDLRVDLQNVFHAFLHHHKLALEPLETPISHIQVITPENIPPFTRRL
ncbi:LacI family DNA-binding transcriptional regulator [Ascidiaceihabitans sp.]|jgi:LacI family transcriptional regulator|nr:LacI family DNA-binding transcriptional regulator [Paracoccaceae bacterium]MDB4211310.1 LacI family DNA-binding transcriptional regulator [Ascidiaceihabitans sp.]MDC1303614.1 LacI family DNA-binding transcriptional regulator [Ascidiaceihabitans sp.]HCI07913.1 LacI family transcriptional regulator [Sulfitobacter sp.]